MKIYYICHLSDPNDSKMRKGAPSADTKVLYIINALKTIGYDVEVLSWCSTGTRSFFWNKYSGYEIKVNSIDVKFFDCYDSRFRLLRIIGRFLTWQKQKKYISYNCIKTNTSIIIYHSLTLFKLYRFLEKHNKNYILEMEEIYSDVIRNKKTKLFEIRSAEKAIGYIFPTQLLMHTIGNATKPSLIVHGTYQVEPDRNVRLFDKDHIHCVYAGTFDPRKGGCAAAAAAAEYLPANYHLHVIGFGNKQDTENIKKLVLDISKKSKAMVTYDGLKRDEEYIQFIQSCEIGLSTQNPDAAFNATSFPSKVLSYLANGLHVVSIKIPAIEESSVGDMLYYYEKQTPEEIAKAILSVNLNESYDSRARIKELDAQFTKDLKTMLDGGI